MKKKKIMVAMVTPFDGNHKIDDSAVQRLCQHLLDLKVDGIVVCGTTGEVSSLSFEERAHLLHLVKSYVGHKTEIWMGCGTDNTEESLKYCRQAEEIGVDGIMLITPYYVRPSQRGLFEHYSTLCDSIDTPVMLYNVPKRTGVQLEARTINMLVERYPHIIYLKQASDDLHALEQILSTCNIQVLCGDDFMYDQMLEKGVDGIVSVAAHLDTSLLMKMHEFHSLGIHSRSVIEKWKQLSRMCFLVSSPSDVKTMLNIKGICCDDVRLPLVKCNEEEKMRLERFLDDTGKMF